MFDITGGAMKELAEASFTPDEAGEYKFQAYYLGVPTPVLEVQAYKENGTGKFLKKWMIMKFTATWCVNCPEMSDAIKNVKRRFREGQLILLYIT